MKRYILSDVEPRKLNGPKGYLYELCYYLGWEPPMFTDSVAGGYRLRYRYKDTDGDQADAKNRAESDLAELLDAANSLGIKIIRPIVKPNFIDGVYYLYCVVPRKD